MDVPFRKAAKVVAIIELVLLVLSGLFMLALVTLAVMAIEDGSIDKILDEEEQLFSSSSRNSEAFGVVLVIIMLLVYCLFAAIQLVASIKLYRASKTDADKKTALKQAEFWRVVAIILCILSILGQLTKFDWIGLILTAIIDGVRIYLVWRFIDELKKRLSFDKSRETADLLL